MSEPSAKVGGQSERACNLWELLTKAKYTDNPEQNSDQRQAWHSSSKRVTLVKS